MAANAGLEKRLKRAIAVLEGSSPSRSSITSPKRSKNPLADACNEIRQLLVDEEFWPRGDTSCALSALFDSMDREDASFRILCEQTLHAIMRKFALKGHPSRVVAALLNELSRQRSSARGHVLALGLLGGALAGAAERRIGLYVAHFFHALRESLRRPEQSIQAAIETAVPPIIATIRWDVLPQSHSGYIGGVVATAVENLSLSGAPNRAAAAVLAAIAANVPDSMGDVVGRLSDILLVAEETTHRSQILGFLQTLKRLWPALAACDHGIPIERVQMLICRCLCCLKSPTNAVQIAALELLELIATNSGDQLLEFCPAKLLAPTDVWSGSGGDGAVSPIAHLNATLESIGLTPLEREDEDGERGHLSRLNSVASTPLTSRAPSIADDDEELSLSLDESADSLDVDFRSTPPNSPPAPIELDTRFSLIDPLGAVADSGDEADSRSATPTADDPNDDLSPCGGPLCLEFPAVYANSQLETLALMAEWISSRFLRRADGSLREDAEIRVALKILALKCLAAIGGRRPLNSALLADLVTLARHSDDAVALAALSLFANVELRAVERRLGVGEPAKTVAVSVKFLHLMGDALRRATPLRLKELHQLLADCSPLLHYSPQLLAATLDSAIRSRDCDYFLLKSVRSHLIAQVEWSRVETPLVAEYQDRVVRLVCAQLHDEDPRVVAAAAAALPQIVKRAQFGNVTNAFLVRWPQSLYGAAFPPQPQVFALHPAYVPVADSPDPLIEQNLQHIIQWLRVDYLHSPQQRLGGFVAALSALAAEFPPNSYAAAWRSDKPEKSLLSLLLDALDNDASTLTQLCQLLRLCGDLFSGIAESPAETMAGNRPLLQRLLCAPVRLLNLYYSLIREHTNRQRRVAALNAGSAIGALSRLVGSVGASDERRRRERLAGWSALNATGIVALPGGGFAESAALNRLEPLFRTALVGFTTTLRADAANRCAAPLEAAAYALTALIEFLPPMLLWPHADELLLYARATMFISMRSTSALMTALIRSLFHRTAAHQRADPTTAHRQRNAVAPTELLDMLVGRSINNYSVHIAFLDRPDFMDIHQQRHIGWLSGPKATTARTGTHNAQIAERLGAFERTVGQLLKAFVGSGDAALRMDILRLVGVLLLNDVRYDRLDPHSRLWSAVVVAIRHPTGKHSAQWAELFRFALTVARGSETPNFGDVSTLLTELVDRWTVEKPTAVLTALHSVLLESIHYRDEVPKSLIELLRREELLTQRPAECIQLWTMLLHWSRRHSPSGYADLSTEFVATAFDAISSGKMFGCEENVEPFILDSPFGGSALSSPLKVANSRAGPIPRLGSNSPAEWLAPRQSVFSHSNSEDSQKSAQSVAAVRLRAEQSPNIANSRKPEIMNSGTESNLLRKAFNAENRQSPESDSVGTPSPSAPTNQPNHSVAESSQSPLEVSTIDETRDSFIIENVLNAEIPEAELSAAEADRRLQTPVPPADVPNDLAAIPPDPKPSASTPTSAATSPAASQRRRAEIPVERRFHAAHSLCVALKTVDPRVFRPIDSLFQIYRETHNCVFAAIPLAVALICRPDQPTLALQLEPLTAPEDPLEWLGGSLARTFGRALCRLAADFRSHSADSELLEEAAAFHSILILHAIRSELSRSRRLVAAFRAELDNQLNGTELEAALWKGAFLFPKPVAIWLAILMEMELEPAKSREWFARTDWPFPIQQLVAALYLQKLCESTQPSVQRLRGLHWASDELCGLMLKVARSRQSAHLGAHLPPEEYEVLNGKLKRYLCVHADNSEHSTLIAFLRSASSPSAQVSSLLRCLDSTPLAVHPKLIDAFVHERRPDDWVESHLSDGFPNSQNPQLAEILIGLIDEATEVDSFETVAQLVARVDGSVVVWLLERVSRWKRPYLIAAFFLQLADEVAAEQRRAHVQSRDLNHYPIYAICAQLGSLIAASQWLSAEDCRQLLVELGKPPFSQLAPFNSVPIDGDFFEILDRLFLQELRSAKSAHRPIESPQFYAALSELLNRWLPERCRRDEYFVVERMAPLLMLMVEDLERRIPTTERLKPTTSAWLVELAAEAEAAERLRDEIVGSVLATQRAAHCLIDCRHLFAADLLNSAESALISILRISAFGRMFCAPRVALSRNWPLRMVGTAERLHIPLVGISQLTGDLEILEDFARRCLLLGWTRRVEFEERWMSLFGVLAATQLGGDVSPSGDVQATGQLATSCAAIRTITAMIAQSALRPEAGDPARSRYEAVASTTMDSALQKSRFGRWAAHANAHIGATFPLDSALRFGAANSPKSTPAEPLYPLGHFSLEQLRNRLVDSPRSPTRSLTPMELASPIESADLDIRSAVRALFDNFFHWTAAGWSQMPAELIAVTVEAMAYLSDFVQDSATLCRLFADLRHLPLHQLDARTVGLAIYTTLKVGATVGSDEMELSASAFAKQITTVVTMGLRADEWPIRAATLSGLLYLMGSEEWKAMRMGVEAIVADFVMEELRKQTLKGNCEIHSISLDHHRLLWRVGFELARSAESAGPDFVSAFIPFVQQRLVDPRVPLEVKRTVAFGVQRLVLHNPANCAVFRDSLIELIDTHQLQRDHLPLAVATYTTVLYRAAAQNDGNLGADGEAFREEFQKLMNLFTSVQPPTVLAQILEPIAQLLCRLLPASAALRILIQIILPPPLPTFPSSLKNLPEAALTPYDLCLHRLLHYSLKCLLDWNPKETRRVVTEELLPTVVKCQSGGLAVHVTAIVKATMAEEADAKGLVHTLLCANAKSSSVYSAVLQRLSNVQL